MQETMLYKNVVRPLLFLGDPEKTHEQTLALLSKIGALEGVLARVFGVTDERLRVKLGSLDFPNPVGLSAGFDKDGVAIRTWSGFGFGFIEIGAVTALAQPGNPAPRLFRLPEDHALINRLGFNNKGAEVVAARLESLRRRGEMPGIPLGINIGRSKIVATKDAVADFLFTFERLFAYGDYFTLNVSSPNTPELRDLQEKSLLSSLLAAVQARNRELAARYSCDRKPVFVKIAPDMEFSQADEIMEVAHANDAAGIIATNATAFLRDQLVSKVDEPGGLSGKPLRTKATAFVRHLYRSSGGRLPIIGSGGIFTAEDAYEKIKAGATAVQIYTGFIYEGPSAAKRINRGLLRLIERDGFKTIADAVGTER